jgi:hypothetical protein
MAIGSLLYTPDTGRPLTSAEQSLDQLAYREQLRLKPSRSVIEKWEQQA